MFNFVSVLINDNDVYAVRRRLRMLETQHRASLE